MYPKTIDEIKVFLNEHGIRPSTIRVKVYEYLVTHDNHPTPDEIFDALSDVLISISKATIYNTLNLFSEKKIVQTVRVEDRMLRYDYDTKYHSHFKCLKCGKIFNIDFDVSVQDIKDLSEFEVVEFHAHVRGYCPKCKSKPR